MKVPNFSVEPTGAAYVPFTVWAGAGRLWLRRSAQRLRLTSTFGDTMKRAALIYGIAWAVAVVLIVVSWFSGLNDTRRPARESRALTIGHDLRSTTNSTMLVGATSEFRAEVASILGSATWNLIDRSPPPDPWAVVRLVLTNDHGQALHIRLRDEYPSGHLRLLSYRRITEPQHSADRSQAFTPVSIP